MKKIENLRNELIGKDLTFSRIEFEVKNLFDIIQRDSFFEGDNKYYAFQNMSHSYEISEDKFLNIVFDADLEKDFDIYEDVVKVLSVDLL
jgi:hypothetical protein